MLDDYISFVIVGKSTQRKAWHWETWSLIARRLDPIIAATNQKAGVRSIQGVRGSNEGVKFGRLVWDEKSHQKWAHFSEINSVQSGNWIFFNAEIWAPSWTVCNRERRNPVIFIKVENPFGALEPKEGQFNQFVQLSVPIDFFNRARAPIEKALEQIYGLLDGVLIIVRTSPWNSKFDSVQDVLNNHLRYGEMYDDINLNLARTSGDWLEWQPPVIWTFSESSNN